MSKKVFFDKEARALMQEGVNIAANAIGSTLGAAGKTVVISPGHGHMPIMTKDGVTVAKSIVLKDELENIGAMLIRNASEATVLDCGDGTTTSAVLAQSMINAGIEAVNAGGNPQEIKAGIEKAVACVVESLKAISIPVTSNDMIRSIATISANNDAELGGKLADAYDKIGNNGLLTIEMSKTHETFVTVMEGAEMPRGYFNEGFVNNPNKMTIEYENPKILVLNYDLKTVKQMEPFLQAFASTHNLKETPLIIIAKDFEGEIHNTVLVNKVRNGALMALLAVPAAYYDKELENIATITGATLISEESGLKPEHAKLAHLGSCKKIVSSRTNTIFIGGGGEEESVDELKRKIQADIDSEKNDDLKAVWEKRLARLSGSFGVIHVGGNTHVEQVERLHRVDDANKAIKSAIEEGIVAGGGIALLRASALSSVKNVVGDEMKGVGIVLDSCFSPLKKMIQNSGKESEFMIKNLTDLETTNLGYNIKTGQVVDMIEAKIIDPTKVVRCALQNAASVVCQVINSEVLLVEMNS